MVREYMVEFRRMRKVRENEGLRRLVRETKLDVRDFVYPLFIAEKGEAIASMPGQRRVGIRELGGRIEELKALGIESFLLFGVPKKKDPLGKGAYEKGSIIQRSLGRVKDNFSGLNAITDVCLCSYTDHGHCGVLERGKVHNDKTLELLKRMALRHAEAGADMVAPSDMMDGRVAAIRGALDREGFETPIMSYAAKFASSFYGPFREAASARPKEGPKDRSGYQMDYGNLREALREIETDIKEGADVVMVKPALAYLDVIRAARKFNVPLAAYNVSGEYVMVKAASERGWIDERNAVLEILTGIKRAGADMIVSYHAPDVAGWLNG